MRIQLQSFGGIVPKIDPTLLGDSLATVAHNLRLKTGKICSLRQSVKTDELQIRLENGLTDAKDAKSIFLWKRGSKKEIIAFPGKVWVANSNIFDDSRHRIFITGETGVGTEGATNQPCVYIGDFNGGGGFERHPICMEQLAAPVCAVSEGTVDEAKARYTSFFQTWVDGYGYESACSLPSEEVTYNDGMSISIDGVTTAPYGASKRRVYKVITGTETESVQLIWEQGAVGGGFSAATFKVKDEDAGEILTRMYPVPTDLQNMVSVPGNFYAGYRRSALRQVCFSDVNFPTSYPDAYKYDVRYDIVGLSVCGNTVFVMTKEQPFSITGTDPSSMSVSEIASKQACVSSNSIVSTNNAVFYASQDGICMLSESSAVENIITKSYWDKQRWSELNPSSCIAASYDGGLFLWFTKKDGTKESYIIDFAGDRLDITTHDEFTEAVFTDCESDSLFFVKGGD